MPKQIFKIDQFHGGLNTHADPRDIVDNQLSILQDASISSVGRIVVSGGLETVTSTSYPSGNVQEGYGLFSFSADWSQSASPSNAETNYLVLWIKLVSAESKGQLYWIIDHHGETREWHAIDAFSGDGDLIKDAVGNDLLPCFYFIDGALRMSDGRAASITDSPGDASDIKSYWFGHIKRTLFGGAGAYSAVNGWHVYQQELKAPTIGKALNIQDEVDAASDVVDNGLTIHVRHQDNGTPIKPLLEHLLRPDGGLLTVLDFREAVGAAYVTGIIEEGEDFFTVNPIVGGDAVMTHNNDKFFYSRITNVDDANSHENLEWRIITGRNLTTTPAYQGETGGTGDLRSSFNTGVEATFGPGRSIYGIFRIPNRVAYSMWEEGGARITLSSSTGFEVEFYPDRNLFRLHRLYRESLTNPDGGYMQWPIVENISDWTIGEYRVVEFPYDSGFQSSYNMDVTSDFDIERWEIHFAASVGGTEGDLDGWDDGDFQEPIWFGGNFYIADSGQIFEDLVNRGRRKWGYSHLYGDQESDIFEFTDKVNIKEQGFPLALTAYHRGVVGASSSTDNRITGANIYFYDDEDTPFKVTDCDFLKGIKPSFQSRYPSDAGWETLDGTVRKSNTITFNNIQTNFSYESLHGYTSDEGGQNNFRATYGNAVLNNRRLIVGPVCIDKEDGSEARWFRDTMIGTSPGEYDLFPIKTRDIEVAVEDGDKIIGIATYADRILQFKKNVMYLINITKSTEYLEDTFRGKGVNHPAAITKTDFGIAWANENGCFFYDGQKVQNLSDMKISDDGWSGHMDSNSLVGYHPNSRKIIVTGGGGNNINAYVFDLVTKSWSYTLSVFDNSVMTNFVNNATGDLLVATEQGNGLRKWTESPIATSNYNVATKDIDFGQPGQRKKIYKVYITHKGTGNLPTPYFDVDGGTSLNNPFSGTLGGSPEWTTSSLTPSSSSLVDNVYSFQFRLSGSAGTDFEVNDISIVYRLKPVK